MKKLLAYDPNNQSEAVFRINCMTMVLITLFGLFVQGTPMDSFRGMWTIWTTEGGLVTDYIVTGGIGGAFLNAGMSMFLAILVTALSGARFSGSNLGACYIVAGFALFGKNVPNMCAILLGTWLWCRFNKIPFNDNVNLGLWATCAGPVVQYMMYHGHLPGGMGVNFCYGVVMGMIVGFVVPAVAGFTSRLHNGLLIYNVGFATGFTVTVLVGILKSFGYEFQGVSIWAEGYTKLLAVSLGVLFALHFIMGFLLNGGSLKGLGNMMKHSGRLPCDYVELEKLPLTLMNMGILGLLMLGYILIVKGNISGPIVAGIITVGGFGAFGKNYYNVIWGILGIVILSFFSVWDLNDNVILLDTCFCTAICGIAGEYGPFWGIISGMLHVSIVRNSAVNYGWLNTYNNGYAAGLAVLILLPIIEAVNKRLEKENENNDK